MDLPRGHSLGLCVLSSLRSDRSQGAARLLRCVAEPFVNQTLAYQALAMLARLFRWPPQLSRQFCAPAKWPDNSDSSRSSCMGTHASRKKGLTSGLLSN